MDVHELVTLARQFATKHGLNDSLVCAICEQESGWNPNATRYEPAFYTRYIQPMISDGRLTGDSTKDLATSWGLMQVMGETARESGYMGPCDQLLEPALGLEWGCRVFAKKLVAANGDAYNALLRWNGGGNPRYPQEVIDRMDKYVQAAITGGDSNVEDVIDAAADEK